MRDALKCNLMINPCVPISTRYAGSRLPSLCLMATIDGDSLGDLRKFSQCRQSDAQCSVYV